MVSWAGAHIAIGDMITGSVEESRSGRGPSNLIDSDRASEEDWRFNTPFTAPKATGREQLLFPDIVAAPPHLGGSRCVENSMFHIAPSMRNQ